MSTFTWTADWSARAEVAPNNRRTKFGEGYELRQGIGMNSLVEAWSVTFNLRETAEMENIISFFEEANGVDSFDWTNPRGLAGKYICTSWASSIDNYNRWNISAKFEKVYEP